MKKLLLLLLQVVVFTIFCKGQTPNWLWAVGAGGGDYYQYANGLAIDDSGYLYIGGRFSGTIDFGAQSTTDPNGAFNCILYLSKFDTSGNCIWLKSHSFTGDNDYPRSFCIDHAIPTNIYDCGVPGSATVGTYATKYTSGGSYLWGTTLGTGSYYGQNPEAQSIAADVAGNVYVTGETGGGAWTIGDSTIDYAGTDLQEMFLTKMDKGGNFLWAVGMDGVDAADDGYDVGRGIAVDYTGQYVYVAGSYTGTPSFHSRNPSGDIIGPASESGEPYANMFLAKYDTAGNLIWVTYGINAGIPDNPSDIPWSQDVGNEYSVAIDSCDNVFVAGVFTSAATFGSLPSINPTNGYNTGFLATCNSNGQWQWVQTVVNPSENAYASSVVTDKDNDVYLGGTIFAGTTNFGDGITVTVSQEEAYVAKYANSNGATEWVLPAAGPGTSSDGGVAVDKNKFVYFTGAYVGSPTIGTTVLPSNSFGLFIAKLDTIHARYIVPVVDSTYCPGEATNLNYNVVGTFNSGNVFTAELSNDSGSFIDEDTIGSVSSDTSGTISITIPPGTTPDSTYLIRVVSSSPATSSYVNGCGAYYQNNVYINNFLVTIGAGSGIPAVLTANPGISICNGTTDTLKVSGGHSYLWGNPVSADSVIIVNPTTTTTYNIQITKGACTLDTSIVITVGNSTVLNVTPQSDSTCNGAGITLTVPFVPGTTYTWTPTVTTSTVSEDTVVASPSITSVYTVTGSGSGGCPSKGTDTVFIYPSPPLVVYPPSASASTCPGVGITLKIVPALGSGYTWSPVAGLYTTTGDSVTAAPFVATTYTVTGIDSQGCIATGYDSVTVLTGFNKPKLTLDSTHDMIITSATQGNQWYRNGVEIGGAKNETYTYTDTGCYWETATNIANGCSSISDTICIDKLTGINRLTINPDLLSIYPNPTGGEIYININASVAEVKNWNLQITDVLGRTVYTRLSLNYSNDIDLSNLASGVYFITIMNNSARAVYPVVKQN